MAPLQNVVVRACAGSGKTWLLTSRIIRILLESPRMPLGAILAITFTENAAAEIHERILERLLEMARTSDAKLAALLEQIGVQASADTLKQARRIHRRVVLAQPTLAIQTFHGWFRHLSDFLPWAQRPVLTGQVHPNPKLLLRQAWTATLAAALDSERHKKDLRSLLGRQKLSGVRSMLLGLPERRLDWLMQFGIRAEDKGAADAFHAMLDQNLPQPAGIGTHELMKDGRFSVDLDKFLVLSCAFATQKQSAKLEPLVSHRLSTPKGALLDIHIVKQALLTSAGRPRKRLMDKCSKQNPELAQQVFGALENALAVDRWTAQREVNRCYASIGSLFMQHLAQIKLSQGVMDFGDMELIPAEALLAGRPASGSFTPPGEVVGQMLERMDASYRHILVDEFQDTSPTQWWMLRTWLDACAQGDSPPAVFVVGDPKQSIYSFRHGDQRLLEVARGFLAGEPYSSRTVEFDTTRRCSQPVVDVVNAVFGGNQLIEGFAKHDTVQASLFGEVYCLSREGGKPDPEEEVEEEFGDHLRNALIRPAKETKFDAEAVAEGRHIATLLEQIVGRKVITPSDGPPRLCTLDDILLLYPSRTGVSDTLRELASQGFPCAELEKESRSDTLEYKDIIALLHSIYDPGYGLMLAHVLSSPIFGVSGADLQAIHDAGSTRHGCDWVEGLAKARGSEELEHAKRMLGSWREAYRTGKLPTHELLALCYAQGDIVPRYMRAVSPRLKKRVALNLEWLLNMPIDAERGSLVQLSDYARHLEELGLADATASTDSNAAGAIRAMTVHKAKGLESPVVILCNSDFNTPAGRSRILVEWNLDNLERGPEHFSFCHSSLMTPAQEEVIERQKRLKAREHANMLYVAMTRAQNILIVSGREQQRRAANVRWRESVHTAMKKALGGKVEQEGGWLAYRKGKPPNVKKPLKEAEGASEPLRELRPIAFQEEKIGTDEVHATIHTRHGELLHNLVALSLAGVDSETARRFLAVDRKEFAQLRETSRRMTGPDSPTGKLIARSTYLRTEMQLIDAAGTRLRVDCYLETENEAWVIDFKTGSLANKKYVKQLQGYMEILKARAGKRRMRAALVGVDGAMLEVEA